MNKKVEPTILKNVFEKLIVEDINNPQFKWYLIQTHSNCEKKAESNIKIIIDLNKLEHKVKEVVVPAIDVVETRSDGKKRNVQKKLYPGYVLVFADMDDIVCSKITNASKVLGFLNKAASSLLPRPVAKHEIEKMISQLKGYSEGNSSLINIKKESLVQIKVEPFVGHNGRVKEVNTNTNSAIVVIKILGKEVEFKFNLKDIELIYEEQV